MRWLMMCLAWSACACVETEPAMLTAAYQRQINLLVYAADCAGNKRQSTELLVQSVIAL